MVKISIRDTTSLAATGRIQRVHTCRNSRTAIAAHPTLEEATCALAGIRPTPITATLLTLGIAITVGGKITTQEMSATYRHTVEGLRHEAAIILTTHAPVVRAAGTTLPIIATRGACPQFWEVLPVFLERAAASKMVPAWKEVHTKVVVHTTIHRIITMLVIAALSLGLATIATFRRLHHPRHVCLVAAMALPAVVVRRMQDTGAITLTEVGKPEVMCAARCDV